MSTETAQTTTAADTSASNQSSSGVDTQSINTQADTTQDTSSMDTMPTEEVTVKKAEKATKDAEAANSKLDVKSMIAKQMAGEQLSESDKAALEKAGLSEEQVAVLADAQKSVQLKNNNTLYELVGGEESYSELKEFAAENLEQEDIDTYNMALRSGNMRIAKMAVLGLKAMMEAESGFKPKERIGSEGESRIGANSPYQDQQELIKDLNSRKYGRDPEFTAQVDARRRRSGF